MGGNMKYYFSLSTLGWLRSLLIGMGNRKSLPADLPAESLPMATTQLAEVVYGLPHPGLVSPSDQ